MDNMMQRICANLSTRFQRDRLYAKKYPELVVVMTASGYAVRALGELEAWENEKGQKWMGALSNEARRIAPTLRAEYTKLRDESIRIHKKMRIILEKAHKTGTPVSWDEARKMTLEREA